MTNAQILKDRIKKQCDSQGKSMTSMLSDLSLGVNAVNQINEKKGMGSFVLLQIADYLDCSVDYLLGRGEKYIGNANVSTGDIKDNHDVNINSNNNGQKETVGEIEQEVSSILSSLTTREKTELMGVIYKYVDEHGEKKEQAG